MYKITMICYLSSHLKSAGVSKKKLGNRSKNQDKDSFWLSKNKQD